MRFAQFFLIDEKGFHEQKTPTTGMSKKHIQGMVLVSLHLSPNYRFVTVSQCIFVQVFLVCAFINKRARLLQSLGFFSFFFI